jgi:hypothetical protein
MEEDIEILEEELLSMTPKEFYKWIHLLHSEIEITDIEEIISLFKREQKEELLGIAYNFKNNML